MEFASYLKHVVCCDVSMDIWEQAEIQSRGPYEWMKEKIEWCQYVIIVCSTGARFKCVRNKQFNVKESRPVPDIFQDAVELVAENIRSNRECGTNASKFIVTYFEYSRNTDIPPKLDNVDFYFLMRDIFKLYCHIFGVEADDNHYRSYHGLSLETYSSTETGQQLYNAIDKAHQFFQDTPNWLGDTLEPLAPPTPPSLPTPTHYPLPPGGNMQIEPELVSDSQEGSPVRSVSSPPECLPVKNGHSRVSSTSVSVASEEDALIDERRRKRQKELMGSLDRVRNGSSRIRNDSLDSISLKGSPDGKHRPIGNGHMPPHINGHNDINGHQVGTNHVPNLGNDSIENIPPKSHHPAFNQRPYVSAPENPPR